MVWITFGERRRWIWRTGCRAMFPSSSLSYINLPKNTCNGKCLNTGIVRAKPRRKALFSHIFMRNFSSFNRVKLFTRTVCMKHLIFFRSHYRHLIVLEGLTEIIVTFSFWWSVTPYIPSRPSIFLKSKIKMLKKY